MSEKTSNLPNPNIIWIYCDELRADALGCYGHPQLQLHTPHIDRLATEGAIFTNHFCNSPVCVSSRVCVLTGLHPEQSGVYNNEGAWKDFQLPRPLETFPEIFGSYGYRTANFGKIHLPRQMMPLTKPLDLHADGAIEVPCSSLTRQRPVRDLPWLKD